MDPIADMLVRISNAYRARHDSVVLPYSHLKERIAGVMAARGFIAGAEKRGRKVHKSLEVKLAYDGTKPRLSGFRRVSKPSRRLYLGRQDIRPVRGGSGTLIMSTPKGIMTGEEARKAGLGGEAMAEVW
ncbi:MAG: 30S ribosomal protein S8 [Candidatus Sungbacteria bacterium]|uniref:Small ribosomal subunit protein uS8 n=1 Tax=Candidatus Sungiibacteriota bacterium TaxID=2750080 RepID=A0A932YVD0_9BACT|nr:30S ribosomal protein S8 [Candidatus Sungbacteria bacterium]